VYSNGSPAFIGGDGSGHVGVQGIAFGPSGSKLYVVDQRQAQLPPNPGWDSAVHVFQVTPYELVYEADYPIQIDFGDNQETEGITIFDTYGTRCPNGVCQPGQVNDSLGEGAIHTFVYKDPCPSLDCSNEFDTWLKHVLVSGGQY